MNFFSPNYRRNFLDVRGDYLNEKPIESIILAKKLDTVILPHKKEE